MNVLPKDLCSIIYEYIHRSKWENIILEYNKSFKQFWNQNNNAFCDTTRNIAMYRRLKSRKCYMKGGGGGRCKTIIKQWIYRRTCVRVSCLCISDDIYNMYSGNTVTNLPSNY